MFADLIRNSNTDREVYFLLTSYLEAMQYGDKLHCCVSPEITRLPLNGIADVRKRFEQMMVELDAASRRLDDNLCNVIKEGMHILGSAVNRLNLLEKQSGRQSTAAIGGLQVRGVASQRADNRIDAVAARTAEKNRDAAGLPGAQNPGS